MFLVIDIKVYFAGYRTGAGGYGEGIPGVAFFRGNRRFDHVDENRRCQSGDDELAAFVHLGLAQAPLDQPHTGNLLDGEKNVFIENQVFEIDDFQLVFIQRLIQIVSEESEIVRPGAAGPVLVSEGDDFTGTPGGFFQNFFRVPEIVGRQ